MTVDEILATGKYTDRRGRAWVAAFESSRGSRYWVSELHGGYDRIINRDQMRLLIERDLHRDVCPGLSWCVYHPVPMVLLAGYYAPWTVVYPQVGNYTDYDTRDEAMDAARALAVGE